VKVLVNPRYTTVALIVALLYEVLLKLGHSFVPSLFDAAPVVRATSVLSLCVALVIVLFLISFYGEERANKKIGLLVLILIGFMIVRSLGRLPTARDALDYKVFSLVGGAMAFVQSVLMFTLMMLYARTIPPGGNLRHAAVLVTAVFGVNVIKNLLSLAFYMRFFVAGIATEFAPAFYDIMLVLFLVTHAAIVYFLYRYYQFKPVRGLARQT
jgi:hypothetical protein